MGMATIGAFVEELGKNDALSTKFETDPVGAMTDFGLDGTQQDQVLTGDIKDLRKQIKDDLTNQKALVFRVKRG